MTEWDQQLLQLRSVTSMSGAIHDAQLLQLRWWGGVAFGGGKGKWEAGVDPDTKTVTYTLARIPAKTAMKKLVPAVAALDRSVHWLLGEDWGLVVQGIGRDGNLPIYQGQREEQDPDESRKRQVARGKDSGGRQTLE